MVKPTEMNTEYGTFYDTVHSMIRYILWYAGGSILFKRSNKRYSWSTSRTLAAIILRCSKWNFSMCKRSVDIWGHLYHVLSVNSLIANIQRKLFLLITRPNVHGFISYKEMQPYLFWVYCNIIRKIQRIFKL